MKISVIIPALNEAARISAAIQSAMRNHADQIIVVDGGSTDQTVQVAQSFPVYVVQAKKGRGHQLNAGVEHATNEVILFLHADNVLSDGCLHQIRSELSVDAGSQIVGGGFRQRIEHHGSVFRLIEAGNAWRANRLGLYYGDQAIFVRRHVLEAIGGVPVLPLMEDVQLIRQVRRHGRLVMLPGPIRVSNRRWQQHGIVRQTLRNWATLAAFFAGVPPHQLARFYPTHTDSPPSSNAAHK
ncbi:MAG: TIGR04283 family arsenosugar biosynthesis glycosyltransferase [Pirellulaceae bacterium]